MKKLKSWDYTIYPEPVADNVQQIIKFAKRKKLRRVEGETALIVRPGLLRKILEYDPDEPKLYNIDDELTELRVPEPLIESHRKSVGGVNAGYVPFKDHLVLVEQIVDTIR